MWASAKGCSGHSPARSSTGAVVSSDNSVMLFTGADGAIPTSLKPATSPTRWSAYRSPVHCQMLFR
ncbi:hypothetical protein FHS40_008853 [Streptomyces spectabilis]|uniref:Uncharacterized protein n=1 Tax=Streptomyces spectabilis TaxID=68270 RepID=A0A7W8EZS7_STRST|nr:hypothetical protein [Streptomyces spectabilis]